MSEEGNDAACEGDAAPIRSGLALLKATTAHRENTLVVPSSEDLALVIDSANTVEQLIELNRMLAIMQKAAEELDIAVTDAIRLAVAHLRARRKLGAILMETVRWGGVRARLQRATLVEGSLPDGVDKFQARRCRQLASIPEGVFEEYLRAAEADRKIPREAAAIRLLRVASRKPSGRQRATRRGWANGLPRAVLDAVERCLCEIDVLVGKASITSTQQLAATDAVPKGLRGTVVVAECRDPEEWLPALVRLRTKAALNDVVVVLPAVPSAKWFRHLADGWCCCFLGAEQPVILAHRGLHSHSFDLVMREHGVVLRATAN